MSSRRTTQNARSERASWRRATTNFYLHFPLLIENTLFFIGLGFLSTFFSSDKKQLTVSVFALPSHIMPARPQNQERTGNGSKQASAKWVRNITLEPSYLLFLSLPKSKLNMKTNCVTRRTGLKTHVMERTAKTHGTYSNKTLRYKFNHISWLNFHFS